MSLYSNYLTQIENRKNEGLKPKPIEDGELLKEIISQIKDPNNKHRKNSIEFLKKGYCVALMIDQRVSEGEMIKFFNKEALTTTLPAQLAKKFNVNIMPVYLERKKSDEFYMEFYKPVLISKYKDKMSITIKLNQILEDMIQRNPKQWIWTHDRWK